MNPMELAIEVKSYERKESDEDAREVYHALAYALDTGRSTPKLEDTILANLPAFAADILSAWDRQDSTSGILRTLRGMGY